MREFFSMGGYAAFVWPAYGATLVALLLAIGATLLRYGRARKTLNRLEGKERRR